MARPQKAGLDYFPLDTDADSDEKVQAMIYLHGSDGWAFYTRLLMRIYKTSTGELDISDAETRQILSRNLGFSVRNFDKMLQTALKKKLFDPELFDKTGRLSSAGVKKRLEVVVNKREEMKARYARKQGVSDAETMQKPSRNSAETPQRKVKESKVNSSTTTTAREDLSKMISIYETNIGMATPLVLESLDEIKTLYPLEWFDAAMKEAVANEARNLKYVKAILARWKAEGFKTSRKRPAAIARGGNGTCTHDEMEEDERRLGLK